MKRNAKEGIMIDMTQLLSSQLISTGTDNSSAKGKEDEDNGSPFMMLVAQMLLQSDNDELSADNVPLAVEESDDSEPFHEEALSDEVAVDLSALSAAKQSSVGFEPMVESSEQESLPASRQDEENLRDLTVDESVSEKIVNSLPEVTSSLTEASTDAENSEPSLTNIAAQSKIKLPTQQKEEPMLPSIPANEDALPADNATESLSDLEALSKINVNATETGKDKATRSSLNEVAPRMTTSAALSQNYTVQQNTVRAEQTQPMLEIPVETSKPEWSEQFNQQIVWMGKQKIDSAQIKLNPPEMGPLEVMVKMDKHNAHLSIQSHSLHVKDMIEQAVPRLREMMSEQGLNLADVNIGTRQEQAEGHGRQGYEQLATENQNGPVNEGGAVITEASEIVYRAKGLVDYFA